LSTDVQPDAQRDERRMLAGKAAIVTGAQPWHRNVITFSPQSW